MINKMMRFLLVSMLVLSTSAMVFAQDSIGVGDSVDGEASESYVDYEIELQEGQVIEIEIEADWDTYLELFNENEESVAYNDDGGDGLQSLLVFNVEESGTYIIRVYACCSQNNPPSGDYELNVEEIEVIDVIDAGVLEYDDDEDVDADDALAIEATFEGEEGDVINIMTVSDDYLNTTMTLFNSDGDEVAESQTYYGDAIIQRVELEESDTYTIRIVESQGAILNGDIEIEIQLTEILTLDNGEIEIEIGDGENVMFINFTGEEDVVYVLNIALDDEPEFSDFAIYVLEEDQNPNDYSNITLRMTGGRGTSLLFETEDDAQYVIRVEYYGGDEIDATFSIEQAGD